MAQFVTMKARRGQPATFRIDSIQQIEDVTGGHAQIYLVSRAQPIEIHETRETVLKLIADALSGEA